MGLCVSHGAMDVPQSPASPMDTRLSQRALHVLWNHTCPLGLWMSHRAICVPSVHVPWSHLCATESYVSLGTGIHRCPMEPSTFCGPINVPCRCPGRHPYPTNLRMLHRAIPPLRGAALAAAPPQAPFWCPPPRICTVPTSVLAIPGWFPSQPCSRLFMAHPDPWQLGCFSVWLNRLWLQPWEEGLCPSCD